jgi:hypothetical protein
MGVGSDEWVLEGLRVRGGRITSEWIRDKKMDLHPLLFCGILSLAINI